MLIFENKRSAMKNRNVFTMMMILLSFFMANNYALAQADKADVQSILRTKNYLFTAQYAQPLSGQQVTLTSTYTLRIAGDSLVCQLPYYGRAYTVENYPGGSGGIMFTSHHFDYSITPQKHNRYMVSIKISDFTGIQQMYLNISKNGYANLQVTPTNKQAISYYGNVTALPARK